MIPSLGIIRPARRPPQWTPPGPPPPPPPTDPAAWPRAGEDLCWLSGNWRILQRLDGHRWSLDDLVTAWYAATACPDREPPRTIVDLGCGIGAVLMLLAWRFPHATLTGIEAQAESVDLARRSLRWNGITDRCTVVHGDLRGAHGFPMRHRCDLVTATPPYLRPGTATISNRPQVGACHVELRGGIEDYCTAAARLVLPCGYFVTCAGASQHARVQEAMHRAGFTIVCTRAVIPRAGKPALFRVYAARPGHGGLPRVEPPLVVRDAQGRRTPDFLAVRAAMGLPP